MRKHFSGIIVPVITPLNKEGGLDIEGLGRLIEHVIGGGAHGIFVLGTSGEGPAVGNDVQEGMIREAQRCINSRVEFLVGISGTSPSETVKLSHLAANHGADAVVVAPPSYFPFSQEELVEYIRFILRNSPLPVMLYNIPKMTKTSFGVETIDRLTGETKIAGFKDSSKDFDYFREILMVTRKRPDWSVLIGYEDLLAVSLLAGGDGGVLAGGNIYPQLLVNLYHAIAKDDREEVASIEQRLSGIRQMYTLGTGATSAIQVIKYALEIKGICSRTMTIPFRSLSDMAGERVREIILKF